MKKMGLRKRSDHSERGGPLRRGPRKLLTSRKDRLPREGEGRKKAGKTTGRLGEEHR